MQINFEGKMYEFDELKNLISKKYEVWFFIIKTDPNKFKGSSNKLCGRVKSLFDGLVALHQKLSGLPPRSDQEIKNIISNRARIVQQLLARGTFEVLFNFFPDDEITNRIKEHFTDSHVLTDLDIYWLAYQFNIPIIEPSPSSAQNIPRDLLSGYIDAWAIENALDVELLKRQKQGYASLKKDFQRLLDRGEDIDLLIASAENLEKDFKAKITDAEKLISKQETDFETFVSTKETDFNALKEGQKVIFRDEFDTLKESMQSEFKSLEKVFEAKLALKAPALYWSEIQGVFTCNAWKFGLLGIAFALGLLYILYDFFSIYGSQDLTKLTLYHLGIIPISLIFVWIIRIFVRCFLTNLHLLNDAKLKETMIKTYLALGKKGTPLDSENERIILSSLFSTPKTGLVKDDGAPIGFIETAFKTRQS